MTNGPLPESKAPLDYVGIVKKCVGCYMQHRGFFFIKIEESEALVGYLAKAEGGSLVRMVEYSYFRSLASKSIVF